MTNVEAKLLKTVTVQVVGFLCYAEDSFGNEWSALVDNTSDTVYVYDLLKSDGAPFCFESEAHKLERTCEGTGISFAIEEISVYKDVKLYGYE